MGKIHLFSQLTATLLLIICGNYGSQNFVAADNILVYGIVGSYSQRITMWPMIEALADRGHNVTFLSPFDSKNPNPKVHDYAPKLWKEQLGSWEKHYSFYDVRKNKGILKSWFSFPDLGVASCEALYKDEEFLTWLKSSKFDLVIVDALFNECAFGMIHFWKTKFIFYGTSTVYPWNADKLGFPDESSSVTDLILSFPPGNKMSFLQRFANAMAPLAWMIRKDYFYLPKLEEISKRGLGLDDLPSFSEMEKEASLALLTTHYTIDYPRSFPPNAVPIGGNVISNKKVPLPKEMEDFVRKSKIGFAYISFGTVAEFVNFGKETQKEFIQAISNFPDIQFVWKSSFDINATLPKHVMMTKWAPQQSLLAHPNIKAFITHSGMGSTAETINFAVPVISFPILAEQDMNADCIASRGAGIKLEITTLKRQELEAAINEILYNSKYKKAMQRLSTFYKDRPMSALETTIWWIEFILRHDNTNEYLQPPSVGQPWWVKRQIDVWLFAVAIAIILITIPLYLTLVVAKKLILFLSVSLSKLSMSVSHKKKIK